MFKTHSNSNIPNSACFSGDKIKTGQRTGAVGDTHFIDVVNCKMINFAG